MKTIFNVHVDEHRERDDRCAERENDERDGGADHRCNVFRRVRERVPVGAKVRDTIDDITWHEDRDELRRDLHVVEEDRDDGRRHDNHNRLTDLDLLHHDAEVIEANLVFLVLAILPLFINKDRAWRRGIDQLCELFVRREAV